MHNFNLRQTLKKLKLWQFLLVKWIQIRAEMIHKQVMNVYVIKYEDKKKKKSLGKNMHSRIFLLSFKRTKSFTCRSLMDQRWGKMHQ